MDEELTEEELARIQKATTLAKVAGGIAAKWMWWWLLVAVWLFAGFSAFLVQRSVRSPCRYEATTRLLYMPRQEGKVPTLGDKQLLRILERRSLKRRAGTGLPLPPGEDATLTQDLDIVQEGRPSNLYTLTARSRARAGAVRKVNAYADVLLEEYAAYRSEELMQWGMSAAERQQSTRAELSAVEAEIAELETQVGTQRPVETLMSMNALISDQRRNVTMLEVEVDAEAVKRDKLADEMGGMGTALLDRTPEIRRLAESIAALDAEISKLREVYTDLNPKVRGKLEDREMLQAQYQAILEEFGVQKLNPGELERADRNSTALLDSESRMAALEKKLAAQKETLAVNEQRAEDLTAVVPRILVLVSRRADLERELKDLEFQLGEAGRSREIARNELRQIERAESPSDQYPLRLKNFLMAAAAAVFCTVALALWTIVLGLWLGDVRGAKELAAYPDIHVLGSLPKRRALSKEREKDVFGVVALNFCNADVPKRNVLICRLRGAKPQPRFAEALDWSLSMSGKRLFALYLVSSQTFEPEEGSEMLINTARKGSAGRFPVANRFALAPTEIEMLRADLATIHEEFDIVFLLMPDGLRRGGNYFSQLLEECDSALVTVGANKTSRREFAYVRRQVNKARKPMMGLVAGERARVVKKEMEEPA